MARVTVLMPVYNVASYVQEAIGSVLAQSYRDFELLVIDDCSTDDTVSRVRAISDPRLRLVVNERNLGLADNLNRGLGLVDTELVARMDGDDIALPHWLESTIAYLDEHPTVGVCGGGAQRFGTSQALVQLPEDDAAGRVGLLFRCSVLVPVVRMSVIRKHDLRYRREAFPAADYRFWADATEFTRLHNLPQVLFRYRMHESQICTAQQEVQKQHVAEVRRMMLRRMGEAVSEADEQYFVDSFFSTVHGRESMHMMRSFAARLQSLNAQCGYYDAAELRRALRKHLWEARYYGIHEQYFPMGYSLMAYLRYLGSGMALGCGWRHEVRFFVKSLLRKKK